MQRAWQQHNAGAMRGLNESRRYEDDEVSEVEWRAVIIEELFHLLQEGPRAQARHESGADHAQEEQAFAKLGRE